MICVELQGRHSMHFQRYHSVFHLYRGVKKKDSLLGSNIKANQGKAEVWKILPGLVDLNVTTIIISITLEEYIVHETLEYETQTWNYLITIMS